MFMHDIALVDEAREGIKSKVERWREISKSKRFIISRMKIKKIEILVKPLEGINVLYILAVKYWQSINTAL